MLRFMRQTVLVRTFDSLLRAATDRHGASGTSGRRSAAVSFQTSLEGWNHAYCDGTFRSTRKATLALNPAYVASNARCAGLVPSYGRGFLNASAGFVFST